MPRYTVNFLVFADESEMAWEGKVANTGVAESTATAYFVDGGNGPLDGLVRSDLTIAEARVKIAEETLTPEDNDFSVNVQLFGARPA